MKYALLIYDHPANNEGDQGSDQAAAITEEYMQVAQSAGIYGGFRLELPEAATTVRVADGESLLTDGPFVDAKEFLGGLFLFEAADLDAALAVAAKIPAARTGGAVEVRPIMEM
ncbi:MAG: hypothetical protein JWM73_317 [Solirubrobacterales bacterium]|nr:hypothetical protein [Solirubrobacterales bacterium]